MDTGRGEKRVRCGGSNMETYITMCKIDSQWEFNVCLREFKQGLCINLEGCDGEGDGREVQEGGDVCKPAGVQLQQPGIQPEGVSSVGEKLRQPLILLGLPVYFKLMILFYIFTKSIGQRFDIFSCH